MPPPTFYNNEVFVMTGYAADLRARLDALPPAETGIEHYPPESTEKLVSCAYLTVHGRLGREGPLEKRMGSLIDPVELAITHRTLCAKGRTDLAQQIELRVKTDPQVQSLLRDGGTVRGLHIRCAYVPLLWQTTHYAEVAEQTRKIRQLFAESFARHVDTIAATSAVFTPPSAGSYDPESVEGWRVQVGSALGRTVCASALRDAANDLARQLAQRGWHEGHQYNRADVRPPSEKLVGLISRVLINMYDHPDFTISAAMAVETTRSRVNGWASYVEFPAISTYRLNDEIPADLSWEPDLYQSAVLGTWARIVPTVMFASATPRRSFRHLNVWAEGRETSLRGTDISYEYADVWGRFLFSLVIGHEAGIPDAHMAGVLASFTPTDITRLRHRAYELVREYGVEDQMHRAASRVALELKWHVLLVGDSTTRRNIRDLAASL